MNLYSGLFKMNLYFDYFLMIFSQYCLLIWIVQRKELGDQESLTPLRVLTTWSKGLSLVYCTIADSRKIDMSKPSKKTLLESIASSWEGCHTDSRLLCFWILFIFSLSLGIFESFWRIWYILMIFFRDFFEGIWL